MEAFNAYAVEKVYIAYDNDPAGNQAALALAPKFAAAGIDVYRVNFPEGMDANSFVLKTNDPAAALRELIGQATPIRLAVQQTAATAAASVIPLAAVPSVPASDLAATIGENEIVLAISDRVYRVPGPGQTPHP